MSLFIRYSILMVLSLNLLSCAVQKRKHLKGFYVSRIHPAKNTETTAKQEKAKIKNTSINSLHQQDMETPEANALARQELAPLFKASEGAIAEKALVPEHKRQEPDTCDVILFKDGSEIKVKLLEVSLSEIKYKRCENQSGPTYVTRKSDLFMIKYKNGSRELVKAEPEVKPAIRNPERPRTPPQKKELHPMAAPSLVCGALGFILPYIGVILLSSGIWTVFPPYFFFIMVLASILALTLGKTADNKIKEQRDVYKGRGLAIPAYIMGIVQVAIWALIGLVFLLEMVL